MEYFADTNFLNSIISFLGSSQNIKQIDFCITRLRISVKDMSKIREDLGREFENKEVTVLQFQPNLIQILFKHRNEAENVANALKKMLK